jgi:hypothetical protein
MAKRIPLTQGKVAIVDDEDYEWLRQWKWHYQRISCGTGAGYAARNRRKEDPDYPGLILMHRVIMAAPDCIEVDHINNDGLDNQRHNLRLATHCRNQQNRAKYSITSSRFKGVAWHEETKKWRAYIRIEGKPGRKGKMLHLGLFRSEVRAAKAYDNAARDYFGEFASVNFPETSDLE